MAGEAEFIEAAKKGDVTQINSLLKADPGLVRAVGDHQKTALHWAAERAQEGGHNSIVAMLRQATETA